jgi:hypothetical protein
MPPQTKPLPSDLTDWVASKHPGYTAHFKEAQYVQCDAWNGTVYYFDLIKPQIPKSVAHLQGYAFALDQFHPSPKWTWDFRGPETPSAKSAVLRALRNSN